MRITSDIIKDLNSIDLSSKVKIAERYEELSSSPVLFAFIRVGEGKAPFTSPNKRPIEALVEIARAEIRHYASTKRDRLNETTLSMIKNRLAVLFAKWEEEWESKTPQEGEGMGYIWNYAREQGLTDSQYPLTKKGVAALDDTAHRILSIFERYFLYSLTPPNGFSMTETNGKEAREEMYREQEIAFATEWDYEPRGLTSSFEEEVQFFGAEYTLYLGNIISAILIEGSPISTDITGTSNEENLYTSSEDIADLQRAKESRYKDYLTIND